MATGIEAAARRSAQGHRRALKTGKGAAASLSLLDKKRRTTYNIIVAMAVNREIVRGFPSKRERAAAESALGGCGQCPWEPRTEGQVGCAVRRVKAIQEGAYAPSGVEPRLIAVSRRGGGIYL